MLYEICFIENKFVKFFCFYFCLLLSFSSNLVSLIYYLYKTVSLKLYAEGDAFIAKLNKYFCNIPVKDN